MYPGASERKESHSRGFDGSWKMTDHSFAISPGRGERRVEDQRQLGESRVGSVPEGLCHVVLARCTSSRVAAGVITSSKNFLGTLLMSQPNRTVRAKVGSSTCVSKFHCTFAHVFNATSTTFSTFSNGCINRIRQKHIASALFWRSADISYQICCIAKWIIAEQQGEYSKRSCVDGSYKTIHRRICLDAIVRLAGRVCEQMKRDGDKKRRRKGGSKYQVSITGGWSVPCGELECNV